MSEFVVPYILDEMAKTVKAGQPDITVFEIINPLTQKPFTILDAKVLIEEQHRTLKADMPVETEEPKGLTEMIPMYDGKKEADRKKFQDGVKKY